MRPAALVNPASGDLDMEGRRCNAFEGAEEKLRRSVTNTRREVVVEIEKDEDDEEEEKEGIDDEGVTYLFQVFCRADPQNPQRQPTFLPTMPGPNSLKDGPGISERSKSAVVRGGAGGGNVWWWRSLFDRTQCRRFLIPDAVMKKIKINALPSQIVWMMRSDPSTTHSPQFCLTEIKHASFCG